MCQVQIELSILGGIVGDLDGDGEVTEADARIILNQEAQNTEKILPARVADVSGDGKVDSNDAVLILQYVQGKLERFPVETEQPEEMEKTP